MRANPDLLDVVESAYRMVGTDETWDSPDFLDTFVTQRSRCEAPAVPSRRG